MAPIGDMLKNIYSGRFLGLKHECKAHFIIITHDYLIPPPRAKTICNSVRPRVFFTVDLDLYVIVLINKGSSPHW